MAALFLTALLSSCGGGSGASGGGSAPPPALTVPGLAVIKARAAGSGWLVLTEKLRPLEDVTRPDRQLLVTTSGAVGMSTIVPPVGWSVIDVAAHPSGQFSVVLASDEALRLRRYTADGALLGESDFTDAQAATDPFIGNIAVLHNPQSLLPFGTRDAVRLAPAGEDLILAVRTGRNAVVAQRLAHLGDGRFARQWRTLVEPGVSIDVVRLTSGTFDPFASLDNQWKLTLDVNPQGRTAIAVSLGFTALASGHREYFGDSVDPALMTGALVTVLDAQGARLGTTVIDTQQPSEVHVLRWAGDTVLVAGRVLTERRADGGGWDGFLAQSPAALGSTLQYRVIDIDRGDVILDVAGLPDGRVLLAGSTGYVQNPTGGSISEDAAPLLAILPATGVAAQRVVIAAGPRHNQVRTLIPWQGRWLVGGLQNGPGTHSADADPALLTCDGYLKEQPVPQQ